MNFVSRTLAGGFLILAGLGFIVASFFTTFILLFYAVPFLIIGLFILFNKKEDRIEEIKFKSGGKK